MDWAPKIRGTVTSVFGIFHKVVKIERFSFTARRLNKRYKLRCQTIILYILCMCCKCYVDNESSVPKATLAGSADIPKSRLQSSLIQQKKKKDMAIWID